MFQFEFKNSRSDVKVNIKEDSSVVEPAYTGPKIAPLELGDKSIEFPYTDNLDGESLIIKSDQKEYTGDSGSDVYFSVTNTSNIDESAILLFYFPGQFIPNRNDPPGTGPATVTSLEERKANTWQKLKFFAKNIKINNSLLGKAISKRKPIPEDFVVKAGTQVKVLAGQTVYFKSKISFRSTDGGEFWIEALGQNGGYGLLDPTYTGTHYGSKASTDSVASWYSTGGRWTNRKRITIDHFKVSGGSNLSNFPVLLNFTDSNLATTANGGKAASGSGEFIITSSNGTTSLPYEIETYSATTGQFVGWVNVTTLSATIDTVLYIYYGGPSSGATNQNKTGTWNSAYLGVWHLGDGTSTASGFYKDSTSNAKNGTLTDANANGVQTTGKIGNSFTFGGDNADVIVTTENGAWGDFTACAWFKDPATLGGSESIVDKYYNGGFALRRSGSVANSWGGEIIGSTGVFVTLTDGQWNYICSVRSGSVHYIYGNGGAVSGSEAVSAGGFDSTAVRIGNRLGDGTPTDANIDEVETSNTARSLGWIATEYNNQLSPSTFFSLGGQEARLPANPGLKIKGKIKFR